MTWNGVGRPGSAAPARAADGGAVDVRPLGARAAAGRAVRSATVGVVMMAAGLATTATIGADSRWLAALGQTIVERGRIPAGVPYAGAPTAGWHNALPLAELLLGGIYAIGADYGLLLAQVAAVGFAFALLALGARRAGATDASTALALMLVVLGTGSTIFVVRLQLFSLALYPLLLLLLRAERRAPSRRIWLVVPLLAVWANLHGGVLVAFAITQLYLVLDRTRRTPRTGLAVAAAACGGILLTPQLLHTGAYYHSLLTNEAARQGIGLWAAPSPRSTGDLLMLLALAALARLAWRSRPPFWELATAALLAVMTVQAARSGVWLMLLLVAPAASANAVRTVIAPAVNALVTAVGAALLVVGAATAPSLETSTRAVDLAVVAAHGSAILADPGLAEQVAVAGGRVWVANPLDAFRRRDQRLWLQWYEGRPGGDRARTLARVVLVEPGGHADRRIAGDRRFEPLARGLDGVVYVRRAL